MKTNANPKTVVQAVENVSKRLYEGNVVFRKSPEKMTKNVCRFTLKTLDAGKPGSLHTKHGIKQSKADWSVHQNVLNEILRLDPRPHIFVDTIYGRQYSKNVPSNTKNIPSHAKIDQKIESHEEEPATVDSEEMDDNNQVSEPRKKRKYTKRKFGHVEEAIDNKRTVTNIVQAIKYIIQNPSVLND